ncbi:hypothetical protein [Paenibacillus kandeliae]|uniref:hypothetical protein n=1 Tax=Paenibacillus kandeliae TaxID=3231269 RepID=UPI0034590024
MEIITFSIDQINAAAYNPRIDLQPGDSELSSCIRSGILASQEKEAASAVIFGCFI